MLLHSVWGVIFLGVIGSLLTLFLVWIFRKYISKFVLDLIMLSAVRIFYPYIKAIKVSEALRVELSKHNDRMMYQTFLIEFLISSIVSFALFVVFFVFTIIGFVLYWPAKPYMLVFVISITLYCLHTALISGMSYINLKPDYHEKLREAIVARFKTFKDFERIVEEDVKVELRKKSELDN